MEIYLDRNGSGKFLTDISTIGILTAGDVSCLTLEDDYDVKKDYAHTRIPAGRYKLRLRTWGSHHEKYKVRFADIHKGMIELVDVPNYKDILIHCGVKPDDTAGCILVGTTKLNDVTLYQSTKAYRLVYPVIAAFIEQEDTYINIKD